MTSPTADIHDDKILILDFGSQYTQLIARRVRELGVYCEIHPISITEDSVKALSPRGVILSGGPESVTAQDTLAAPSFIFELGLPVLGICYGMQTMAQQLGGRVEAAEKHEFGHAQVTLRQESLIFSGLEDGASELDVWMSHGDQVVEVPAGFAVLAKTESCPVAAMSDESRQLYGLQFHPEVQHTPQGGEILDRFLKASCNCRGSWTPANIVEDIITNVRRQVGARNVILGLSGGVDSSVVAALLARAIGEQLTCVFVDNGLLRLEEGDQVMAMMDLAVKNELPIKVVRVDAAERFLSKLKGVTDPEAKRKVIGNTFIEVFDEEAAKIQDADFLAQGTIYPDVIESAGTKDGKAHVIKSHHNVGGLPDYMKLKVIEPLKLLFKDEVRRIGRSMNMDENILGRHPFPGPGLGIRILGDITAEKVNILQEVDHIFISSLKEDGLYDDVWQAGAIFLPIQSVGVMGDERTYENAVALRAVTSTDGMTADWCHLPYEFLAKVSNKIINGVKGINRVTYDISSKPPATIEWE